MALTVSIGPSFFQWKSIHLVPIMRQGPGLGLRHMMVNEPEQTLRCNQTYLEKEPGKKPNPCF